MALRWGLLSTARINDAFLAGVAESPSADVVTVASRDAERARAYAQAHGIASSHGSYDALFADPTVDAVYISLPNGMHLDWTERALRAGKHVLCEKPLGRDPDAARRRSRSPRSAGLRCARRSCTATTRRPCGSPSSSPRARSDVAGDSLELLVRALRPGDVRLSSDLEGGALLDLGCYCVSAARLLAGEPEAVAGVRVVAGGASM